jgi:hypothetical protein
MAFLNVNDSSSRCLVLERQVSCGPSASCFSLADDALEGWNSLPEKIQGRGRGAELRRISPRISQVFRNGVQTSMEVD